jgi:hypothetical protein
VAVPVRRRGLGGRGAADAGRPRLIVRWGAALAAPHLRAVAALLPAKFKSETLTVATDPTHAPNEFISTDGKTVGGLRACGRRHARVHDEGVIVETGEPREMLANPRHERTRAFLAKVL